MDVYHNIFLQKMRSMFAGKRLKRNEKEAGNRSSNSASSNQQFSCREQIQQNVKEVGLLVKNSFLSQGMSSLIKGDEGSFLPNCQTNLV